MTTATPDAERGSRSSAEVVLEARELSAGYGSLAAVRDLSLTVRRGEVVALLGANGAGKTTTMLALSGELQPMGGEVLFGGSSTRSSLTRRARQGMTFITEERSVFMGLTVAENLRLGRGDPEKALELFPMLRDHLNRKAGALSGGQQQILTVARALASDPAVLLADELSLGLAPLIVEQLLQAVRDAADKQGVGVLIVEQHVRNALAVADWVYVMQRARCVLEGSGKDLAGRVDEIEQTYMAGPAAEAPDPS